jgi:hypothetical protein
MADNDDNPPLPGDEGRSGAGDAAADFRVLENRPDAKAAAAKRPNGGAQTRIEAGERS